MEPKPYSEWAKSTVELLDLLKKVTKLIFELIEDRETERLRKIKGAVPASAPIGSNRIELAEDQLEDLDTDKRGGPESHL